MLNPVIERSIRPFIQPQINLVTSKTIIKVIQDSRKYVRYDGSLMDKVEGLKETHSNMYRLLEMLKSSVPMNDDVEDIINCLACECSDVYEYADRLEDTARGIARLAGAE